MMLDRLARQFFKWLPALFLLAAGPVMSILAVQVPPGEVPDEPTHLARADSVTRGQLSGSRRQSPGGGGTQAVLRVSERLVHTSMFFDPGLPFAQKHVTRSRETEFQQADWDQGAKPVSAPNTAVYPPTFYIPAALAIAAARVSGLSPYQAFIGARLMNAMTYLLIGSAAIALAKRGRVAALCLMCLPMSLWLAASLNPDGLIIATSAMAGALLTRQSRRCWWIGVALLGLAAASKPYLVALALALPVTYPGRWYGREAIGGLLAAVLPAAVWTTAMGLFVAVPFVRMPPMPAGPLWPGPAGAIFTANSPTEQLRILLSHPTRLMTIPIESFQADGVNLWQQFLGVLGTLDLQMPEILYNACGPVVIAAMLGTIALDRFSLDTRSARRMASTSLVVLVALISAVFLAFVLQYLSWTHVGSVLVEGMQGRYFAPLLAFSLPLIGFSCGQTRWTTVALGAISGIVLLAALSNIITIPSIVLAAYYTN